MAKSILWVLFFCMLAVLFVGCKNTSCIYQPQSVDLEVFSLNGRVQVKGSSVFQLPDSFVWCGSPLRIKDHYFLFYSAWESGPNVPPFTDSWVLNSKIGCAVSDSPYGNFHQLKIVLKGTKDQGDSTGKTTTAFG